MLKTSTQGSGVTWVQRSRRGRQIEFPGQLILRMRNERNRTGLHTGASFAFDQKHKKCCWTFVFHARRCLVRYCVLNGSFMSCIVFCLTTRRRLAQVTEIV